MCATIRPASRSSWPRLLFSGGVPQATVYLATFHVKASDSGIPGEFGRAGESE